jgi:hypothetical protein
MQGIGENCRISRDLYWYIASGVQAVVRSFSGVEDGMNLFVILLSSLLIDRSWRFRGRTQYS